MRKDYIKIDDKKYRVVINMNTIEAFAEYKGWTSIEQITNLSKMSFSDFSTLMFFAISEGERLDKKVYELDIQEQKSRSSLNVITAFSKIFEKQCAIKIDDDSNDDDSDKKKVR